MTRRSDRRGFTLVELIVVIGMLMLLAGAISSSIAGASRRAKIQRATTEAQEMTKAILSYENYGDEDGLQAFCMEEQEATESSLGFILGLTEIKQKNGEKGKVPVLFNGALTNGKILDPWGNPYRVTIRQGKKVDGGEGEASATLRAFVSFPNYNRRPADKVNGSNTQTGN